MIESYENIQEILDCYGFESILRDNNITLFEVLEVLDDHGYIDLSIYEEKLNEL